MWLPTIYFQNSTKYMNIQKINRYVCISTNHNYLYNIIYKLFFIRRWK